jgi:hypothetical protein
MRRNSVREVSVTDVLRWDRLPPVQQLDGWHEAISSTFVPLEATALTDRAFGGELATQAIGPVQLSQVSGGPVLVERTPRTIRRDDPESYKLGMQVHGYCVLDQDGREAALTPGDFAIYDTTRPYTLTFERDFRMLVVMFPRSLLGIKTRDMTKLTARRVSGRRGIGALVSPFLARLARQMDADDLTATVHLADAIIDLVSATFAEQLGANLRCRPTHTATRLC